MFLINNKYWKVKETRDRGRGIFATKDIKAGSVIGDYIGKVIKTAEEDIYEKDKNLYLMYYNDRASIYPDIKTSGIHLLNHSCSPNCWMYTYKGHTLFFAIRHIFSGEELTISYLLSPGDPDPKSNEFECMCGSNICNRSMLLSKERYKEWAAFTDAQAKKTKAKRITYGIDLKQLDLYPKNLPDNPIYTLFGYSEIPPLVLNNKIMPQIKEIRKIIRETGKILHFPNLNLKVLGVIENKVFSKPITL